MDIDQSLQRRPSLDGGASNHFSSFATYLTSTVGVTILLMPKLFHQAGMIVGTIEIIAMGTAIYFSTSMLCKAAFITKANSYYETMLACVPNWLGLANTLYLLLLFGNILVYQTFALKNLIPILNFMFHLRFPAGSTNYMLLSGIVTIVCNLIILPFLFSRRLKFVKVLSNICAVAVVFSFVVIVLLYFFPDWFGISVDPVDWDKLVYAKWDGAFICVGYYLLSFCFQQIAVEISSEIRPRTTDSTDKIIFLNCVASILIYLIVSLVGYLTINQEPNIDQMNNFITYLILDKGNTNLFMYIIDMLVIFAVTFANILNYIPTIKYLKARFNPKPEQLRRLNSVVDSERGIINEHDEGVQKSLASYNVRNSLIVWVLFLSVLVVNIVITVFDWKLDFVFNLVSAVGGPAVLIVMPSWFFLAAKKKDPVNPMTFLEKLIAYKTLVIGMIFWAVSVVAVFYA